MRFDLCCATCIAALVGGLLTSGCDRPVSGGDASSDARPAAVVADPDTTDAIPAVEADGSPPVVTFAAKEHDFGRILETEIQKAVLNFTNTGGSPLIVKDVKTTCGCTAATLTKRELAPGESGQIEVEFDPAGPGERQRKYVKLIANTTPEITQMAIVADVDPFVIIEPRKLELGVLRAGQVHVQKLTITATDPDFEIEQVRTTNPLVRAEHTGTLDPGAPGTPRTDGIDVTIDGANHWGPVFSWLEIDVRGRPTPDAEPITYEAKMRVQGQLFGQLQTDPDTFRFGAAPGEQVERTVRLTHVEGEPFVVIDTTLENDRWIAQHDVEVTEVSTGVYDVKLTLTAGPRMAQVTSGVILTTNVPGEEQIMIPISGVIRQLATVR